MENRDLFLSGVPIDCRTPHDAAMKNMTIQGNDIDYCISEFNDGNRAARFHINVSDLEGFTDLENDIAARIPNEPALQAQYKYEIGQHFNWVG